MAVQNAIEFFQGEDVTLEFTVEDAAGAAVDVTGWTTTFSIARTAGDAILVTAAGAIIDAATGRIDVVLTDTDTDTLSGSYAYDFKRMNAGSEAVLSYGPVTVRQKVTA